MPDFPFKPIQKAVTLFIFSGHNPSTNPAKFKSDPACLGAGHDGPLCDLVQLALEVEDASARSQRGGLGLAQLLAPAVRLHMDVGNLLFDAILHLKASQMTTFW